MKWAQWILLHRRSLLFFLVSLVVAGVFSAFHLPVTLLPQVDFPRVEVTLDAGDRPAEQMAMQVTIPVEEAARRVPGVEGVRSTTSRGTAEVSVTFPWGQDMTLATLQINAAIAQILPTLPPGTTMLTRHMDPTVFPFMAYSLISDQVPLTRLYDLAQYQLRPLLSSVPGVARIQTVGGAQEEVRLTVNPDRLLAYGMTLDDISRVLTASNVVSAVGRLEDHYKLYLGISDNRLQHLEEIRALVLRSSPTGVIRVRDVAEVTRATTPQWIRVNADGHDAVLLNVYQQPAGNSVQISQDIERRLHSYSLPPGVHLARWYDQSQLVIQAENSVRDAIIIGVVLAALVLFLFLRTLKVTLIAIFVVPAVLATAMIFLNMLNMGLNIMTLGGMAAAVGLIIDDAIVMLEHIVRRLRSNHWVSHTRVMSAALEFTTPLAGSSAATLVIFIPLAFLDGVTGAFFKALSLTMAISLVVSFLVTWIAVPLLADRFLGMHEVGREDEGVLTHRIHALYERLMQTLLRRPWQLLWFLVPLLAGGYLAWSHVGSGFMPAMDEGGFVLDYRSQPGTSLTETDRLLRQVEHILRANPNVATYSRRTGTQLSGGVTEANEGDFFIRLKGFPRQPIETVMENIRTQIEHQVPGLDIELAQLMEDMIGDLTSVPEPIEIKWYGDDPEALQQTALATAAAIAKIPGVVDIKNGINPAGDALEVRVDRDRAALEGVDPTQITALLSAQLSGIVATQIQTSYKMIDVRVWIPESARRNDYQLRRLLLRAPDGHLFPMARIATLRPVIGQPEINRDNLKRMIAVTARISGRDMGSTVRDVQRTLSKVVPPPGGYYALGGLYQQQQEAFRGLVQVFMAAIALVFLLLLGLYEQFRIALVVMVMPILALASIMMGLWLSGIEINISAMMGMTMIVGIVTEVAIFYFTEWTRLPSSMPWEAALIEAGRNRLRPITMTTLAAILILLPLALAWGEGAQMQQPLAVAIIAGLVVQLPLVLVVMPLLFHLLARRAGQTRV
ncbi:MAG: efflux RND transporter permease subunit [Betaproteobacteria bacterium]|jgi:Cation/multidrug efflux pump|nr:efflux RND transporter permease subunit [Betaproteobacteria bacterium]